MNQETAPIAFSRPFMGEAEAEAAAAVVRGGWIVGGPKLAAFEERFAALCGAPHAVGVSSWTTGAFLLLHALGIGPGDEVLVPSLTFIASVNVIAHAGAKPVFVDVDPQSWNICPVDAARKVTSRTKAIIPVDQIGLPCEIGEIQALAAKHNLIVIQDAACSFAARIDGRPVGSMNDLSVFSLHARKVITTGEGGVITTHDAKMAERLRMLRHQGMSISDFARHSAKPTVFESYPEIGYNFRITDIQAAIGLVQLDRLDAMLTARREIAAHYDRAFSQMPDLRLRAAPAGLESNWQSYMLMLRDGARVARNDLMDRLYELGVPTRRGVMASHLEAPYAGQAKLPVTEHVAARSFQLPMHPGLTEMQQARVIAAMRKVLEG
jgi:perosamine synthetase